MMLQWINAQWQRVKHFRHGRFDNDLAEEMRLHLDLRAAESPGAERETRVRFGNLSRIQEDSRNAWRWPTLDSVIQDVRYGIRTLAASPAFTITAIVSLTLGIGANTAIFSLLNAILLRTLPVQDPAQLVYLQLNQSPVFSNPLWEQVRDHSSPFEGALAYGDSQFDLSTGGERQFASGLMVSGDYFRTLGVPALRGRLITPDDDKRGCGSQGPVAVISHRFWQNHFDGDPGVVGRTITLDRLPFQVAGVTPSWFTGLDKDSKYDVAVPIACEPLFHADGSALDERSWWWLRIVARLKTGVSVQRTESEIAGLTPGMLRASMAPEWKADEQKAHLSQKLILQSVSAGFSDLGRMYGKALFTLQAVVAIVLLIACANVANLLLARATARQRELSVRLAIGAGRTRIVRQLLTESLLLGIGGAIAGLFLAAWGTKLLVHMLNSSSAGAQGIELDTSLDITVVAFTALVAILTTLFFGLLPALRASATAPNDVLKEHGRGSVAGSSRLTLAKLMVAIQLGLALTLLSGAALFGESFRRILTVDAGFDARNVVLIKAEVPQALLAKAQRTQLFDQALDRVRQIPGIRSASRSMLTPISRVYWNGDIHPDGRRSTAPPEERFVYLNRLSPGYFQTMGATLIAGRDFDARDSATAPRVIVLGESTARAFWGSANPIGRIVTKESPDATVVPVNFEVIGVVKDMKYQALSEKPVKLGFFPAAQDLNPESVTIFELRLDSMEALSRILPLARAVLVDTNKNMSLDFQTLNGQVSDSLIQPRLMAAVSGVFGGIALVLAATGLYGVIAYATARRKAEIGLRMALGASSGNVVRLVLRDTALTLIIGTIFGLTAAHFAGKLLTSLVFGVQPGDPAVLAAALTALIATAVIAAYIPARRAARLDPMDSLRID